MHEQLLLTHQISNKLIVPLDKLGCIFKCIQKVFFFFFFFFFLTFCKLWLSLDLITMKLILGTIIRFLERKRKSRRQVSAMILRPKQLFFQSKGGDTFLSISMLVFILASNLQPYYMIKAFGFILVPPHAHVSIWNTSRKCGLQLPSKKKKVWITTFYPGKV